MRRLELIATDNIPSFGAPVDLLFRRDSASCARCVDICRLHYVEAALRSRRLDRHRKNLGADSIIMAQLQWISRNNLLCLSHYICEQWVLPPSLQSDPVYTAIHVQLKPFIRSVQLPPFLQGLGRHSLISATPTYNLKTYCQQQTTIALHLYHNLLTQIYSDYLLQTNIIFLYSCCWNNPIHILLATISPII